MSLIGLIGLMGLMGLMGCSGDNGGEDTPLPVEELVPIALGGTMQDEQTVTRSSSLESTGTTTFTVYGYKNTDIDGNGTYTSYQTVFPGYAVSWQTNTAATTTTNSQDWEYVGLPGHGGQTVKFWDWSATAYRFFGVTGTSGATVTTGTSETTGMAEAYLTFRADASTVATQAATPYYSHLWFSNGNPASYPDRLFGHPVQLEFLKPFCKVRFMFIYEDPTKEDGTTLSAMSFAPTNGRPIARSGELTVTYPLTGTATAIAESCALTGANPGSLTALTQHYYETPADADAEYWYTVLPATGQGTYTLEVEVNGLPQSCVVPADFMEWLPGYSYTYVFKLHVDGGVSIDAVQSAFTSWVEGNEGSHPVYNW